MSSIDLLVGTVVDPLVPTVQTDGAATPVPATNGVNVVLAAGSRVVCAYVANELVILAKKGVLNTDQTSTAPSPDVQDAIDAATTVANEANAAATDALAAATGTVFAPRLIVGAFDNLIANGGFETGALAPAVVPTSGAVATAAIVTSGQRSGASALQLTFTAATTSLTDLLYLNGPVGVGSWHIPVQAGQQYYGEAQLQAVSGTLGAFSVAWRWMSAVGVLVSTSGGTAVIPDTAGWWKVSATATAPAGAAYGVLVLLCDTGTASAAVVTVDDVYARQMTTGQLIVDGAITAGSAIIADAAIDSAKIRELAVDRLIDGELTAAVSVTTGRLTAGGSGLGTVTIDGSGIAVANSSGVLQTAFSTDGEDFFKGNVEAQGVEVNGTLKIHSTDSEVSSGGVLNIAGGITAPSNAPQLTAVWRGLQLKDASGNPLTLGLYDGVAWDDTNSRWISVQHTYTSGPGYTFIVMAHNATTGAYISTLKTQALADTSTYSHYPTYGIAVIAGEVFIGINRYGAYNVTYTGWAMDECAYSITNNVLHKIKSFAATSSGTTWPFYTGGIAGIGCAPGTTKLVATYAPTNSGALSTVLYDPSAGTTTTIGTPPSLGYYAAWYGTADLGTRLYFGSSSANPGINVYNSSLAAQATETMAAGAASFCWGVGYATVGGVTCPWASNGSWIYFFDGPSKYTSDTITYEYTWRDTNATGGQHETTASPAAAFTGKARSQIQVTTANLPAGSGGTDDVNAVRVYASKNAGTYYQQFEGSANQYTNTAANFATSGNTPGGITPFPTNTPGQIVNSTGDIVLPGVGRATLNGIFIPVELGAGDVNSVTTPGCYSQSDTAEATTANHYPVASLKGMLEVFAIASSPSYVIQRYSAFNSTSDIYQRNYVSGTWTAWTQIGPQWSPVRFQGIITTQNATSSGMNTVVNWTEVYDTAGAFNPTTGVFTVPAGQGGLYLLGVSIYYGTNSTRRFHAIAVNGSQILRYEGPATAYSASSDSIDWPLSAGDTVIAQTYTAAAATIRGDVSPATFWGRRVV